MPISPFEIPKILIVDDQNRNIQAFQAILTDLCLDVMTATSGNQALEMALKHEYALVLMDIQMSGMDGFETTRILRNRSNVPVIFITAMEKSDLIVLKGYALGAVDFIIKPIIPEVLKSKIAVFVELYQNKKKLERLNETLEEQIAERTREIRLTNKALEKFIPKNFIHLLNHRRITEVTIGDFVEKRMTVMFADIRSFTSLSETMKPEETFRFINSYLSFISPPIWKHGGFIDKYMGDGIMALFEKAADATNAAISMMEALRIYNGYRKKVNYRPIDIGIGINTGQLILGTVGGADRLESTVVGDTVNLASHIEQLTKVFKSPVLIGSETFLEIADSMLFTCRYIDYANLKDKRKKVMVYEVLNAYPPDIRLKKQLILKSFEHAVAMFQAGESTRAYQLFQDCQKICATDQATSVYLKRIKDNTYQDKSNRHGKDIGLADTGGGYEQPIGTT